MKAYAVVWSLSASATMDRLDNPVRRRIYAKVKQASTDPERFSLRLVNSPYRRIRVGDWRVIIHIDHGTVQVIVIDIWHRTVAYG